MIKLLKNQTIGVFLTVCVLSGIGFFMHKATSKENRQTITVEKGATANIHTEVQQGKSNWSVGIYTEKDTETSGVTIGVSVGYQF